MPTEAIDGIFFYVIPGNACTAQDFAQHFFYTGRYIRLFSRDEKGKKCQRFRHPKNRVVGNIRLSGDLGPIKKVSENFTLILKVAE